MNKLTVGELKKSLKGLSDDTLVVVPSDSQFYPYAFTFKAKVERLCDFNDCDELDEWWCEEDVDEDNPDHKLIKALVIR